MKKIFVVLPTALALCALLLLLAFSSCASGVTSTIPESGEYGAYSSNVGFILDYQKTGNNYLATMTIVSENPFYCYNQNDSPMTHETDAVPMSVDNNGNVTIGPTFLAAEAVPACYSGPVVREINFQGTYNGNDFILTTNAIDNTPPVTMPFRPFANKDALQKIGAQIQNANNCNCQEG